MATALDLAAFRHSMIAPVKRSVNYSRIAASMRETGWEQQQEEFVFAAIRQCEVGNSLLVLLVIDEEQFIFSSERPKINFS